jgi:Kef-type K+ transport system membrane component KefB
LHHEYHASVTTVVLHPLYLLAGSAVLGYVASLAAMTLARGLGKTERGHLVVSLGLIAVTVAAARVFELSVVLALLAFGAFSKNLDRGYHLLPVDVGWVGQLFVVVLFVVSGASLNVADLATGGTLALVYVLARFAGKSLGVMSLTYLSGVRKGAAGLLCLALVPMSGTAVSMVHRTGQLYPDFGAKLAAIVLSAVLILELIGPIAVQFALRRAGEAAEGR